MLCFIQKLRHSIDSATVEAAGFGVIQDGAEVDGRKSSGHCSIIVKAEVTKEDLLHKLSHMGWTRAVDPNPTPKKKGKRNITEAVAHNGLRAV